MEIKISPETITKIEKVTGRKLNRISDKQINAVLEILAEQLENDKPPNTTDIKWEPTILEMLET